MQDLNVDQTLEAWMALSRSLSVPHTEEEYNRLVSLLDSFIDMVGEDEAHPVASLMEVLGVLIEKYEDEHVPELTSGCKVVAGNMRRSQVRRNNQQLLVGPRAQQMRANPKARSH